MAIEKFWGSVRTAMELFEPPYPNVPRTAAWLNRHAVDGFDPLDFDFLADDERERLEASVAAFRQAAAKIGPTEPPTMIQLEQGAEAIKGILRILEPNRNYDPEFFRIKKILDAELAGKLPDWVEKLVYEPRTDFQGESAFSVWVMYSDEAEREGWVLGDKGSEIIDAIQSAYRWTGSPQFLSVHLWNQAKLDAVKAGRR